MPQPPAALPLSSPSHFTRAFTSPVSYAPLAIRLSGRAIRSQRVCLCPLRPIHRPTERVCRPLPIRRTTHDARDARDARRTTHAFEPLGAAATLREGEKRREENRRSSAEEKKKKEKEKAGGPGTRAGRGGQLPPVVGEGRRTRESCGAVVDGVVSVCISWRDYRLLRSRWVDAGYRGKATEPTRRAQWRTTVT